jgi:hypothetical protein
MSELAEAEAVLKRDGRYAWLLSGRQAWSVAEIANEYSAATGVPVSHDTVTRWARRMAGDGAENYGGTIGWRIQRDALIQFFAQGKHLRQSSGDDQDVAG